MRIGLVVHTGHRDRFAEAARALTGVSFDWAVYEREEQIRELVTRLLDSGDLDGLLLGLVPFARVRDLLPHGLPVAVTRSAALDLALATEVAASGAATVVIAEDDGDLPPHSVAIGRVDPVLAPAVAVIPLQLLAWRIAREKGRDPGRFTLATKVTTRE